MWQTDSWRNFTAKHIPDYPDQNHLSEVEKTLGNFPPLVFAGEVRSLKRSLADVAEGNGFLLQGGDCAETFVAATADSIRNRIKTILQMAAVLQYHCSRREKLHDRRQKPYLHHEH